MHCLFRDGKADWDYLDKYTDAPRELEAHLRTRDPAWASAITGTPVETIEEFAKLIGENKRAFFRLGYGFSRSRNGAVNMHAASCIPAVTGAWQLRGRRRLPHQRRHLQSRQDDDRRARRAATARCACSTSRASAQFSAASARRCSAARRSTALIIQNTNPVSVAPDQNKVKRGFAREDLFVCVHEQFMTETAQVADVVLPATTFLEHDDIYRGGGHNTSSSGPSWSSRRANAATITR